MKFILFIVMLNGTITTAEYNNEAACILGQLRAETKMLSATVNNLTTGISATWCSPKGLEE